MAGPVRGLLVGRFQPFHRGHLELVRGLVERTPPVELLIVIGSAEQAFTWENPFTAGERFEMIERSLREAGMVPATIVPVPDISRHGLWVRYLEGLLPPFERVYTHNPLTRMLFEQARYPVESPPLFDRVRHEGSRIREMLSRGEDVGGLVPPAVSRYLEEIGAADRLRLLLAARRMPARPSGSRR